MKLVLLGEVSAAAVIGGAERVLREQALGLRRLGHRVELVVRQPAGEALSQVAVGDLVERRYRVSRLNEPAFVLSSLSRSVRAFDQARDHGNMDAVIIHQSLAGLGPLLRRRRQARGWVYLCLSLSHEEYLTRRQPEERPVERMRGVLNARIRRWIERAVMHRCERVVVLSDFMRRRVIEFHGMAEHKLRMVPGAADPVRFSPPRDPADVRHDLKLPLNKVVLFTVRNLVPRMGLDNLLQAIAALDEEGRDLILLIGGEGPLRPALDERIRELGLADQVHLLGFIPEDTLSRYYQAADLVVMPTQQLEGFGLVTVEALACGTPVLGTPVGAIPEVLARVDPVLVTEGPDARSLAAGIRRILRRFRDRPGEQKRLSLRGRALVESDYTWERHVRELERVLREVCPEALTGSHGG